ncbi:hypothetical protein [Streptomyces sp. NPDC004376]
MSGTATTPVVPQGVRSTAGSAPTPVAPQGVRPATDVARTAPRSAPPARRTGGAPWDEPRRTVPTRAESKDAVGWVKAHGGAGATSLADLLGGVDVGARWPEPARGEPRRIVLVGRTSAHGMRSVSRALGALHEGRAPHGLELLAVVLVADAPARLPLGLLRRVRILRSAAHVHRVPWIPAWRVGAEPRSMPRQLATLARLVGADPHAGVSA